MNILVSDTSPYLGRALVRTLAAAGHKATLVTPDFADGSDPHLGEWAVIPPGDHEALLRVLRSADAAFYLQPFPLPELSHDVRESAQAFASCAKAAGLKRIISLGPSGWEQSGAMRLARETTALLQASGAALLSFRAAAIVGAGSPHFELVRCLGERLPVVPTARWMHTRLRPIAVTDLLSYLTAALPGAKTALGSVELAGDGIESYATMVAHYARTRGLRRWFLPLPLRVPPICYGAVGTGTSLSIALTRFIAEQQTGDCLDGNAAARSLFPGVRPMSFADALQAELREQKLPSVRALVRPELNRPFHRILRRRGFIVGIWETLVQAETETVFRAVERIGGTNGWYFANELWQLRGLVDRALGGPGMRRRRRDPERLEADDVLDCWRVESVDRGRAFTLRAEMKMPGCAWLRFECLPQTGGRTLLRMLAYFEPLGLGGEAYWYLLYPIHVMIFDGMHKNIAVAVGQQPLGAQPAAAGS